MISKDTYIAATRFGMGVTPSEVSQIESSPQSWLLTQIQQPEQSSNDFAGLATARTQARKIIDARQLGDEMKKKDVREEFRKTFQEEMKARMTHAITTPTPFYERLVNFWSNHFTVSVGKGGEMAGIAGAYERETIRPYVSGRFVDMLQAVAHHPAMLLYLDNAQSIGPDSPAGERTGKGLNENLAREIMELHTLGVNSGYTQQDVTTFAKVITGWSLGNNKEGISGDFTFAGRRHEPGAQTIMGRTYPDDGEQQGINVLNDLAIHPSTAQHIATKLVRHFVADNPPPDAISLVANTFLETGGNLPAVYQALVGLPEAWAFEQPKIKSSYDLIVSAARLCDLGRDTNVQWCAQSLHFLGNIPMTPLSPAGFPDTANDIAGPEQVLLRVEWAQSAAKKMATNGRSYKQLADLAIGPIMSPDTKDVLHSAHNENEGLALLFGSPEFQRR